MFAVLIILPLLLGLMVYELYRNSQSIKNFEN